MRIQKMDLARSVMYRRVSLCASASQDHQIRKSLTAFFRRHVEPRAFESGVKISCYSKPLSNEQVERFHHPGLLEAALFPIGDGRIALLFQLPYRFLALQPKNFRRIDLTNFSMRLFSEGNRFRLALMARHKSFMALFLEELKNRVGEVQLRWFTPMLQVAPILPGVKTKSDGSFSHLSIDTHLVRIAVKPFDIEREAQESGREEHLRQIARDITKKYFGEDIPERPSIPFEQEFLDGLTFGTQIQQRLFEFLADLEKNFPSVVRRRDKR